MNSKTRSLTLLAACAVSLVFAGCGRHGAAPVQNDEGGAANAPLVSSLKMNAPSAKAQLTKGFYPLESGAWRWTAGNFTVLLKTPPGAAQKGATLTLSADVSDAVLKQVHSQSLTAAVGPKTLKTETYADPGGHTFTADVPASLLTGDTLTVDFSLDNSLPPGPSDRRELGVIVTSVSLDAN